MCGQAGFDVAPRNQSAVADQDWPLIHARAFDFSQGFLPLGTEAAEGNRVGGGTTPACYLMNLLARRGEGRKQSPLAARNVAGRKPDLFRGAFCGTTEVVPCYSAHFNGVFETAWNVR